MDYRLGPALNETVDERGQQEEQQIKNIINKSNCSFLSLHQEGLIRKKTRPAALPLVITSSTGQYY